MKGKKFDWQRNQWEGERSLPDGHLAELCGGAASPEDRLRLLFIHSQVKIMQLDTQDTRNLDVKSLSKNSEQERKKVNKQNSEKERKVEERIWWLTLADVGLAQKAMMTDSGTYSKDAPFTPPR
jgi:hypothetical protein